MHFMYLYYIYNLIALLRNILTIKADIHIKCVQNIYIDIYFYAYEKHMNPL